jgi:hypothetical protein
VIIEYEGQRYEFDFEDITVKQAIKIEKHTGMGLAEWGKALADGAGAVAMQAVGWLVLHGGRDIPIEDCDFKIAKLGEAFTAAAAAEETAQQAREAAEAAGPTAPAAQQNGSGGGGTRALSLPSSTTV